MEAPSRPSRPPTHSEAEAVRQTPVEASTAGESTYCSELRNTEPGPRNSNHLFGGEKKAILLGESRGFERFPGLLGA